MFVKYCGFTRAEDLEYAAALQVSAVGFIFHSSSKRYVSPERALELTAVLKNTGILKVGVFVSQTAEEIRKTVLQAGLDMLQIYDHSLISELGTFRPLLITYRVKDSLSHEDIIQVHPPHLILLDAYHPDEYGGTGHDFDRRFLTSLPSLKRTIIAGGITPENVTELLNNFQPYGIDISSGIEKSPGIKDREKMKLLMEKVVNAQ